MIRCEEVPEHPDFRALSSIEGLQVDLRYASTNNFSNRVLYRSGGVDFDCAYLRREAAEGLEIAVAWLVTQRPGYQLLVLDALRPQRVQEAIWAEAEGTQMEMYFANPAAGSVHSYGMAVDVTLLDPHGNECDMGTGFDAMTVASHPALHAEHLALGILKPEHLVERGWLAAAMSRSGFNGISTEWWHFDFGDRDAVRRNLPRVY
jgi:zinc D-Ala-D-Ala dipeptidase